MSKQNLVVRVGSSQALSEVVQNLLLKFGYKWGGASGTKLRDISALGYDTIGAEGGYLYNGRHGDFTGTWKAYAQFDAEKDFGGFVKFLETPESVIFKLNASYTAVVGKTNTVVTGPDGKVTVPNATILKVAAEIEKRGK